MLEDPDHFTKETLLETLHNINSEFYGEVNSNGKMSIIIYRKLIQISKEERQMLNKVSNIAKK